MLLTSFHVWFIFRFASCMSLLGRSIISWCSTPIKWNIASIQFYLWKVHLFCDCTDYLSVLYASDKNHLSPTNGTEWWKQKFDIFPICIWYLLLVKLLMHYKLAIQAHHIYFFRAIHYPYFFLHYPYFYRELCWARGSLPSLKWN